MTRTPFIVLAVAVGLFLWLFADALFGGGMFVFRDAAHYYYPLFQFVCDEWAAGRVPLWNPYENLGQPLAADPTASVFYPGKLIFALPIDFAWAYKAYIMAHLLLAAAAAYRLARHFSSSIAAAGVCAVSYAFSGSVLFGYCNVVFLVGAAWLPAAMLAADRMLREGTGIRGQGLGIRGRGRVGWAVVFGVVLALMVLGGDPQMAYNAGLLAAAYALWLWWHDSPLSLWSRIRPLSLWERVRVRVGQIAGRAKRTSATARSAHLVRSRPVLLALAAVTGLILSAVQVVPSMEFAQHSDRVVDRSLEGLLCRFQPDTHQEHVYHFSVGPWRLAEYIWPNFSGRQFPVHRRWLEVIPAEGRIWTPSLYMGMLPLLLAISAMQLRGKRSAGGPAGECLGPGEAPRRFYAWVVVLAVVASFGWYGLGWLVQEIRIAAGADALESGAVGPPFGGLYWLMTVVLPGYAYFRYPAKLLVVAALGLSLLAARGWDETLAGGSDRVRRWLVWLGGLSLLGAAVATAIRPFWHGWLSGVEPDVLFGPLDTSGAASDLLGALVQTAVLCGISWWLLRRREQAPASAWKRVPIPSLLLLLVAVDLAVANRWMVVCAPADLWKQRPRLAAAIGDHSGRVFRHPIWMPERWASSSSPDRLAEAMQWDLDTLWPKYHLAARVSLVEVHGAMMLSDYQAFLHATRRENIVPPSVLPMFDPFLSCNSVASYAILPGDKFFLLSGALAGGERVDVDVEDVSLWHNPRHVSRTSILHDASAAPDDNEWCRLAHDDPLRVEIEAQLARPGMVVLSDQFYPGWQLEVETAEAADDHQRRMQQPAGASCRSVPILRTGEVMRGAWLPAGRHRLTYRYRPASFICGALTSGLGWLAVLVGWAAGRLAGVIRRGRANVPPQRTGA